MSSSEETWQQDWAEILNPQTEVLHIRNHVSILNIGTKKWKLCATFSNT